MAREHAVLDTRLGQLADAITARDWAAVETRFDRVRSQAAEMAGTRGRPYDRFAPAADDGLRPSAQAALIAMLELAGQGQGWLSPRQIGQQAGDQVTAPTLAALVHRGLARKGHGGTRTVYRLAEPGVTRARQLTAERDGTAAADNAAAWDKELARAIAGARELYARDEPGGCEDYARGLAAMIARNFGIPHRRDGIEDAITGGHADPGPGTGMHAHDGLAPHSHEVRPDHLGVQVRET
jgi:hypothetical protein